MNKDTEQLIPDTPEEVRDKDPVPDELQGGDIVIEAGAYEGAWALKVCEQCPQCKVYAFEPATRAYKMAQEKLKDCPSVTLYRVALGKQDGMATLCDCNRDGANTLDYNPEGEPSETVPVIDAVEVLEPLGEIGLMHLNAEGSEADILERLIETKLIERVRMILIQWHQSDDSIRARVTALTKRLTETHEYEPRYFWGCWKRRDTIAHPETKGEKPCS